MPSSPGSSPRPRSPRHSVFAVARRPDFCYNVLRREGTPTENFGTGMDIIAENQTERTIQALMNGDADAKTQQAALAAVLRTTMAQARELEQIKQNLWKPDDLEKAVDAQIKMKCRECPAKRAAEKVPQNWLLALVTSESFRYFILILMFAWALIVVTSGRENAKAVGEHVRGTVTGGVAK